MQTKSASEFFKGAFLYPFLPRIYMNRRENLKPIRVNSRNSRLEILVVAIRRVLGRFPLAGSGLNRYGSVIRFQVTWEAGPHREKHLLIIGRCPGGRHEIEDITGKHGAGGWIDVFLRPAARGAAANNGP